MKTNDWTWKHQWATTCRNSRKNIALTYKFVHTWTVIIINHFGGFTFVRTAVYPMSFVTLTDPPFRFFFRDSIFLLPYRNLLVIFFFSHEYINLRHDSRQHARLTHALVLPKIRNSIQFVLAKTDADRCNYKRKIIQCWLITEQRWNEKLPADDDFQDNITGSYLIVQCLPNESIALYCKFARRNKTFSETNDFISFLKNFFNEK